MRVLYKLSFILLLLQGGKLYSQATMDSLSVEEYVQDILLGSGIQATNISFSGCLNQIGYLQNADALGYGLSSGLVLGSDHAFNVLPDEQVFLDSFECPTAGGDPDLLDIANSVPPLIGGNFNVLSINEQAILEFDFVPTGDTLRFRYIFSSSEYEAFENTQYNDVFAFLLSGPGISGPYASPAGFPDGAMNIAVVPESNPPLPITISSVNATLNTDYYINDPAVEFWQPDGYTIVLEAIAEVVCGETYHIKLAIADGSDTSLGSWVLLEEGSFSSNAVVDVTLNLNVGGPDANVLFEDCGEATLTFTRAEVSNLEVEDMVVIEWGGTAMMGVDYTPMPDTLIFPPGVSSLSFTIDAFLDGLVEGTESVVMNILNLGACNGSGLISNFDFIIQDLPEPLVVEGYNQSICNGATVVLEPIITGGYGNYEYSWNTGELTPTLSVSPTLDASYTVTVSDTCGMPSDDGTFLITVLQFPPLAVEITNGDILLNCNDFVDIFANATGGDGLYEYLWTDEDGNNLFGWSNSLFYGSWNGEGQVNVTVTDGCGLTASDVINVDLNVPELIVDVPASIDVTCNTPYVFTVNPTGGEAPYNYTWELNGVFDWMVFGNTYTLNVTEAGILTVYVGDACGQNQVYNIPFQIVSPPVTFDLPAEVIGNCSTIFNVQPTNITGSGGYEYEWLANGVLFSTAPVINNNFTQNTALALTVTDACGQSGQGITQIVMNNPAINLSLGADINASCIDTTFIAPTVAGGSGGFEYTWMVADTVFSDAVSIDLQSFETVTVSLSIIDNCGTMASDEINYIIPNIPITFVQHPDTTVCPGSDVNLFAIAAGGEGGFEYQWTGTGIDSTHVRYNNLYASLPVNITTTDICGKSNSTVINVVVAPVDAIFASQEVDQDRYLFTDYSSSTIDPIYLDWYVNGELVSNESEFDFQFDGLGSNVVLLRATNQIGCWDTTSAVIFSEPLVYIPSAFTPNGDGINDAFFVKGGSIREFEFRVFDRWGNVVFESRDPETPWLGDFKGGDYYITTGIYNYTLKVKGFKNEALEKVGTIQVVR